MYIIKNAVHNLGRNKGRNILMAVITFAILFAVAVSIVVNVSTTQLIDRQKATFGAPVTLVQDYRKIPSSQKETRLPTAQEMMRYADSALLLKSQLFTSLVASVDGKAISRGTRKGLIQDGNKAPVELLASSRKDISDEFSTGKRRIVNGDFISGAGQALISENLAELNEWKVGDSIIVYVSGDQGETSSMTLTIVGIYEDHTAENKLSNSSRRNEIYTDFKTLVASEAYQISRGITQGQFVLKDPAELEAFTKELREKGLPQYYNVTVDASTYNKIVGPLEGLKSITGTLTTVVTLFGAAVLLLLSVLSIRERKYEVGVLRAMGVKKGKISLGLVTETVLITLFCLFLAVGSASVLSRPIGNALLQTQMTSQSDEKKNNINEQGDKVLDVEGGFKNITADESDLPVLEAELDGGAAAQIVLIALLLAGVASAVSVIFVTRFEPMKILSERN